MELAHRWGDRNLTRLELVIALLILAALIGIFSRYMLLTFAKAERSMINYTVINLNSVLNLRASMAAMMNVNDLEKVFRMNPMQTFQSNLYENNNTNNSIELYAIGYNFEVSNYGGVLVNDDPDYMEKGKWYYLQGEHILIYTVNNTELFKSNRKGLARINFELDLEYEDVNENGKFDIDSDKFQSVKYKEIDDYIWDI